jgi:DNA-binding response OmpR family regulator
MSSSASEARDTAGGRLGGARADFVASLGRKVSDGRELLNALEEDPSSKPARDELRRRLHALGSGARLLRFEAMARSLQEALAALDRGGQSGMLREQDLAFLGQVLDDLPALAWGESPPREAAASIPDEVEDAPALPPITVLVVGPESLADVLTEEAVVRSRAFECERTENLQTALELARAYAPDIVLIDADYDHAAALVEALLEDPMTEPVPVVVVGTFRAPDEGARFIALGVAKTLARPVGADVIRHACDEILDAREGRTVRMTLGEPTLEQLADRLSRELRAALVEGVDAPARSCRVPLGEGTEVLGALWGAIARIQEIVSQRTKGAVRFGGDAPEGAIALAPWLHQEQPGADRMAGRGRGAAADVRLNGRRVVVADDDPGVTWFIADLLRTAGCEVHEALDGTTALELAFRVQPELVVSDILMPGLDGFALCRALRRDVALRDTPVMLLSWKEDLLQRVRELGASAAAYMRKESDSRAVLARVREVLRPRARIEARLRGDGEVRGRLDDLTPRLLLDLVGSIRKDARVAVRDATFLYEIDVRDGAPRKATRTASDGSFRSGERALAMLLAVGAGRFVVSSSSEPVRGDLTGTLFEQLARPLAAARGALAATTGARTMEVERILLDATVLEEYLRATPDPARAVLKRLAGGVSPRQMLLDGETSPSLLEDLLSDLAARCAIRSVVTADGTDVLTPAVEAAHAVLMGATPPRRTLPPNARPSVAPRPPAPPAEKSARAATTTASARSPLATTLASATAATPAHPPAVAPVSATAPASASASTSAPVSASTPARAPTPAIAPTPVHPSAPASARKSAPTFGPLSARALAPPSSRAPASPATRATTSSGAPASPSGSAPGFAATTTRTSAPASAPSHSSTSAPAPVPSHAFPDEPYIVGFGTEPPPPPPPSSSSALSTRVADDEDDDGPPSSLADAVMREISDRTPDQPAVRSSSSSLGGIELPPIVEPSELRPRSSNPPANVALPVEPADEQALLPSIPPDAIVPEATSNDEFAPASVFGEQATAGSNDEDDAKADSTDPIQLTSERRLVVLRNAEPVPAPSPADAIVSKLTIDVPRAHGAAEEAPEGPEDEEARRQEARRDEVAAAPAVSAAASTAAAPILSLPPEDLHEVPESLPPAPPTTSRWGFVLAFVLLAGVVGGVLRMAGREVEAPRPTLDPPVAAPPPVAVSPEPTATVTALPPAPASALAAPPGAAASDDLPPGTVVPAGYGMLEIAVPPSARVRVDGAEAGKGPLSSSAQRAGYHQVRIDQDDKSSQYVIEVRAGKTTRVKSSPLP